MRCLKIRSVVISTFVLVTVLACQVSQVETESMSAKAGQVKNKAPEVVKIQSLDELMALFDRLNYNSKSWAEGNREVPRLTFERVRENWKKTSQEIPVSTKKQVFFRMMAPLVLMANEKIINSRQHAADSDLADPHLKAQAIKYKVISDPDSPLDETQRQELLNRIDILPPSLVLAQAA